MKNIKIAYALSFLWRSWFWLGIWVFYYLRFTDYAGLGFIEAVMITSSTLGEIPTGAIADIIGKRKAVILAFFLGGLGNLIMAFSPDYWVLLGSIVIMTMGGAFYSGSLEALIYDTLLENKLTNRFQKVIGRITTMQNLGMAVAGVTGGYLYTINVSLPFVLVAVAYLIGLFLALNLTEPKIDTEKYSWKKFLLQNKEGFNQLFPSKRIAFLVLLFLIPGSFMVVTWEVLDNITALELGYTSSQLGMFITTLFLIGIFISEKSSWVIRKLSSRYLYVLLLSIFVATLLLMSKATFIVGSALLVVRYCTKIIFDNYQSARLNEVIDSRYRATTLSTFSLLRNIPYVFAATSIGVLMNIYTVKVFSLYFGITSILCIAILYLCRPLFRD